jgi:hypothetical protein
MATKIIIQYEDIKQYIELEKIDEFFRDLAEINIKNGVEALNKTQLWEWIKTFQATQGFFLSDDKNMKKMHIATSSVGHSGLSFATTMRMLQKIANHVIKDTENIICVICLSEDDKPKHTLECYHTYHTECISNVYMKCPMCRSDTVPEYLNKKQ